MEWITKRYVIKYFNQAWYKNFKSILKITKMIYNRNSRDYSGNQKKEKIVVMFNIFYLTNFFNVITKVKTQKSTPIYLKY